MGENRSMSQEQQSKEEPKSVPKLLEGIKRNFEAFEHFKKNPEQNIPEFKFEKEPITKAIETLKKNVENHLKTLDQKHHINETIYNDLSNGLKQTFEGWKKGEQGNSKLVLSQAEIAFQKEYKDPTYSDLVKKEFQQLEETVTKELASLERRSREQAFTCKYFYVALQNMQLEGVKEATFKRIQDQKTEEELRREGMLATGVSLATKIKKVQAGGDGLYESKDLDYKGLVYEVKNGSVTLLTPKDEYFWSWDPDRWKKGCRGQIILLMQLGQIAPGDEVVISFKDPYAFKDAKGIEKIFDMLQECQKKYLFAELDEKTKAYLISLHEERTKHPVPLGDNNKIIAAIDQVLTLEKQMTDAAAKQKYVGKTREEMEQKADAALKDVKGDDARIKEKEALATKLKSFMPAEPVMVSNISYAKFKENQENAIQTHIKINDVVDSKAYDESKSDSDKLKIIQEQINNMTEKLKKAEKACEIIDWQTAELKNENPNDKFAQSQYQKLNSLHKATTEESTDLRTRALVLQNELDTNLNRHKDYKTTKESMNQAIQQIEKLGNKIEASQHKISELGKKIETAENQQHRPRG